MKNKRNKVPNENKEEHDPRKVVRSIGDEIREKSKIYRKFLTDASKDMTRAEDLAGIFSLIADSGSDYTDWENIIASGIVYRDSLSGLDNLAQSYITYRPAFSSTSGSAIAASSDAFSVQSYPFMNDFQIEKAEAGRKKIRIFVDRDNYQNKVKDLLVTLGFDGTETLSKFNGAWEIFLQRPEGVDVTVGCAIPLRETFLMVISRLLQLRPTQEKAKGREIISIGYQIGLDNIDKTLFDNLQLQIDNFLNKLSGKKQKIEDVRVVEEFLINGTLLLASFLEALDPNKLKK